MEKKTLIKGIGEKAILVTSYPSVDEGIDFGI